MNLARATALPGPGRDLFAAPASPNEAWKPVPGYEGLYEASSLGRVRSVDRVATNGAVYRGKLLSVIRSVHGYCVVNLSKGDQQRQHRVHRLVAAAFFGPCPSGMAVAHGDGDRANNRLANLRYASQAENEADKGKHGTVAQGEAHGCAILTEQVVLQIRQSGLGPKDAAARFGISPSQAGRIIRRQNWRHVA